MTRQCKSHLITTLLLSFTLFLSGCNDPQSAISPTEIPADQPEFSPPNLIGGEDAVIPPQEIEGILEGLKGLSIDEFFEKSYQLLGTVFWNDPSDDHFDSHLAPFPLARTFHEKGPKDSGKLNKSDTLLSA